MRACFRLLRRAALRGVASLDVFATGITACCAAVAAELQLVTQWVEKNPIYCLASRPAVTLGSLELPAVTDRVSFDSRREEAKNWAEQDESLLQSALLRSAHAVRNYRAAAAPLLRGQLVATLLSPGGVFFDMPVRVAALNLVCAFARPPRPAAPPPRSLDEMDDNELAAHTVREEAARAAERAVTTVVVADVLPPLRKLLEAEFPCLAPGATTAPSVAGLKEQDYLLWAVGEALGCALRNGALPWQHVEALALGPHTAADFGRLAGHVPRQLAARLLAGVVHGAPHALGGNEDAVATLLRCYLLILSDQEPPLKNPKRKPPSRTDAGAQAAFELADALEACAATSVLVPTGTAAALDLRPRRELFRVRAVDALAKAAHEQGGAFAEKWAGTLLDTVEYRNKTTGCVSVAPDLLARMLISF